MFNKIGNSRPVLSNNDVVSSDNNVQDAEKDEKDFDNILKDNDDNIELSKDVIDNLTEELSNFSLQKNDLKAQSKNIESNEKKSESNLLKTQKGKDEKTFVIDINTSSGKVIDKHNSAEITDVRKGCSIDNEYVTIGITSSIKDGVSKFVEDKNFGYADIKDYSKTHSKEETYNYLVEKIKEAKSNPDALKSIVNQMLDKEKRLYDFSSLNNGDLGPIGENQSEVLDKILNTDKSLKHAICSTIHGFIMEALKDAGIKAMIIGGRHINSEGDVSEGHGTLLYQTEENKYVWNDYNESKEIVAGSFKEALQTAMKNGMKFVSNAGYIELLDSSGNYSEYLLTDEAAYGEDFDNNASNKDTAFKNSKISGESGLNINISDNKTNQKTYDIGGKYVNKEKGLLISGGVQVKETGESANFYSSHSYGAKLEVAKSTDIKDGEYGTIETDIEGVINHTKGSTLNEQSRNFSTTKLSGGVSYTKNAVDVGNVSLDLANRISGDAKVGFSDEKLNGSIGLNYDTGATLNIKTSEKLNFSLENNVGIVLRNIRQSYTTQNWGLSPALKANAAFDLEYKPVENVKLSASGNAFVTGNDIYQNYGVSAGLGVSVDTNKDSSVSFGTKYSMERTSINLGGFHEALKDEQKVSASLEFKTGSVAGYAEGELDINNPKKFSITAGTKILIPKKK